MSYPTPYDNPVCPSNMYPFDYTLKHASRAIEPTMLKPDGRYRIDAIHGSLDYALIHVDLTCKLNVYDTTDIDILVNTNPSSLKKKTVNYRRVSIGDVLAGKFPNGYTGSHTDENTVMSRLIAKGVVPPMGSIVIEISETSITFSCPDPNSLYWYGSTTLPISSAPAFDSLWSSDSVSNFNVNGNTLTVEAGSFNPTPTTVNNVAVSRTISGTENVVLDLKQLIPAGLDVAIMLLIPAQSYADAIAFAARLFVGGDGSAFAELLSFLQVGVSQSVVSMDILAGGSATYPLAAAGGGAPVADKVVFRIDNGMLIYDFYTVNSSGVSSIDTTFEVAVTQTEYVIAMIYINDSGPANNVGQTYAFTEVV